MLLTTIPTPVFVEDLQKSSPHVLLVTSLIQVCLHNNERTSWIDLAEINEINKDVVDGSDTFCDCLSHPNQSSWYLPAQNRNARTRCEVCSKLTIKTPERRHWRRSGVFIVNFEHISHLVLLFLLPTLSR